MLCGAYVEAMTYLQQGALILITKSLGSEWRTLKWFLSNFRAVPWDIAYGNALWDHNSQLPDALVPPVLKVK